MNTPNEWAALIGALIPVAALIGAGFGYLIRMIVNQSKEAVVELRKTISKVEKDRDLWRDRALASGWRADR